MKHIFSGFLAASVGLMISGCVSSGPAPQDMPLQSPDGKAVIIKDIYELPALEGHQLTGTEIIRVFFPKVDNAKIDFSMTALKVPSGIKQQKYKQTSSQIIHTISGGGKLQVGKNIIVLKKGIVVYVPPNAEMSITNNVDKILELLVVTSPPFQPSQMTLLEEKPEKVKVAKDTEDEIDDEDVDIQAVSEKYKTSKKMRERSMTVEEYRTKMYKELAPALDKDDPISKLLNENIEPKTKGKKQKKDSWPLKMPDSSKTPLKKLEEEQEEKLIPKKPQKAEDTSLKNIQELSEQEHKVPLRDENGNIIKKAKKDKYEGDELDKLLKEQEQQKRLHEKPVTKVKKTSMKNVQELSPSERGIKPLKGERENALKNLLKEEKKKGTPLKTVKKVKKVNLGNIQELKPKEKGVKPAKGNISPLEDILKEQKEKGVPLKTVKKVKKTSLKNIQELSTKEKEVKPAAQKKEVQKEDPLEKLLEEQKKRSKELQNE